MGDGGVARAMCERRETTIPAHEPGEGAGYNCLTRRYEACCAGKTLTVVIFRVLLSVDFAHFPGFTGESFAGGAGVGAAAGSELITGSELLAPLARFHGRVHCGPSVERLEHLGGVAGGLAAEVLCGV